LRTSATHPPVGRFRHGPSRKGSARLGRLRIGRKAAEPDLRGRRATGRFMSRAGAELAQINGRYVTGNEDWSAFRTVGGPEEPLDPGWHYVSADEFDWYLDRMAGATADRLAADAVALLARLN